MAQSNKILTVSYGTFSCTLEGFDNPFAAMQSIAEYFRDLTAEDRYFGAEPPQPDAQMLHQIAEREVRRRVETRVAESGIVLRQTDETASDPPAATTEPTPPATAETDRSSGSETGADRLARIRAVAAKARAERDRTYEEGQQVEDEEDDPLLTTFSSAEEAEVAEESRFSAEASGDGEGEPSSFAADTLDGQDEPAQDPELAPPDVVRPAVLSHIPAPRQVGDVEGVAVIATGLATDPAQRAEPDPPPPVAVDSRPEASSPDTSTPAHAGRGGEEDTDATVLLAQEAERGRLDVEEPAPEAPSGGPDEGCAARAAADTEGSSERPGGRARDEEVDLAALKGAIAAAEGTSDGQKDAPHEDGAEDKIQTTSHVPEDWIDVEVEEEDGTPRTIRMSRAEFEDALANGELEEIESDEAPAEDAILEILAQTSLTDADASALAADLAAVVREPQANDATTDEDKAPRVDNSGDRTVSRLLNETNAQMGEPEGLRRRTAVQHLRAAVAATKADGGPRDRSPAEEASIRKFRDDLQKVVRPSPAEGAEAANPLGPLVLVSSQRVDARTEPVRPVRPFRDGATPVDLGEPEAKETFLEFAAKLGAREMPDLLEAAAAYSEIVEGQDGAPRPVLIRRATEAVPAGSTTREDGLKSFGQLLRSGRIRKVEAGRFALADDAEMAKKARAAH